MRVAPVHVPGKADGAGAITLIFPTVRSGKVWTGNLQVPLANAAASWAVQVDRQQVGTFAGATVFGPIQLDANRELRLIGTGLTANLVVDAVWYIAQDDPEDAPPSGPAALAQTTISGPVTITGPVTVQTSNTPGSVTQTGASTTLSPPAGTPSAASRSVSSSSSASATVSGAPGTSTTLIAAPGAAAQLELHNMTHSGIATTTTTQIQVQRSDNNAVLWDSGSWFGSGAIVFLPFDFQGVALPANVGIKVVLVAGDNNSHATVTITYNVLT